MQKYTNATKIVLYIGLNTKQFETTETEQRERLLAILHGQFNAFTVLDAAGCWEGQSEPSVSVILFNEGLTQVHYACERIKAELGQDAVLIECSEVAKTLI